MAPLLDQIDGEIDQFTADGVYDGKLTYWTILQHSSTANVVVPPRRPQWHAVIPDRLVKGRSTLPRSQATGRLKWQAVAGHGKRALIETAIGRYKALIG